MHPVDVWPVRTCSVCMSGTHNTHYLFKLKGTHAVTPACLRLRVAISTSAARRARPGREGVGEKKLGHRRASRSGRVDIYEKCLELTHLRVISWKVVSGCTSKLQPPLPLPPSFLVCLRGFVVDENTKRWEEKNDTESCLICCVYRRWMMDTITHL